MALINKKIKLSLFFSILAVCVFSQTSYALPQTSHIVAGNVTIQQTANHIEIKQTSDKAIVEWNSFNISSKDSVDIQQPKHGVMLIRITQKNGPTVINGRLTASGQIILINSQNTGHQV